jgi:hypothetical protein
MTSHQAADHLRNDPLWEGNVQSAIAAHLVADGARIIATADTASQAHGVDIVAEQDGQQLLIEVKGYPSGVYARGAKAGQRKKPQSAEPWLAKALFTTLRTRAKHPQARVGIGLPDMPRYRDLLSATGDALTILNICVFMARTDGSVYVWNA